MKIYRKITTQAPITVKIFDFVTKKEVAITSNKGVEIGDTKVFSFDTSNIVGYDGSKKYLYQMTDGKVTKHGRVGVDKAVGSGGGDNSIKKELTENFEIPTAYLQHQFITVVAKTAPIVISTEGKEKIGASDTKTLTEINGILFLQTNNSKDGYNIIQFTG